MRDSQGSSKRGEDIDLFALFNRGIPFEGPIDIDYLGDAHSPAKAWAALKWISDPLNEMELKTRHTQEDVARAWKLVFRGCIAQGVEIPERLRGYAARLGVVLPG